jgi:hypothetical protein
MIYRFLLVAGLACFLLAGCSSNIETEIVGEWRGVTPKQDLVFHDDGQIEMKSPQHSVYEGNYTIADGNKLTCEFPSLSNPVECTAKISGDKLTLVHPGGRKEVYVRN